MQLDLTPQEAQLYTQKLASLSVNAAVIALNLYFVSLSLSTFTLLLQKICISR